MSQFLARKLIGVIRLNCSYNQYRTVACNLRNETKRNETTTRDDPADSQNELSGVASSQLASSVLGNVTEIPLTDIETKRRAPPPSWQPCYLIKSEDLLDHYKKLSKFKLTTLVVITTMAGYAISPGVFDPLTFTLCSLGTGMMSAAANSINQYHEVPFDSQMSRTKNRVLVTGKLTPLHAVSFALCTSIMGSSLLYFHVNELTALLSGINLLLYTSVYTPMKRITILNTWVGSIVGAIPPLIGWAGCSGSLDAGAWILAGLLYAWQFPHFNALSWNLRPDYSRAGYRMMAVTNPELCRRTAFRYTIVIALLSYLPPLLHVTNPWFGLLSTPINGYFCYLGYKFYKHSSSRTSRSLFKFSLIHLPALMLLFILCKEPYAVSEGTATTTKNDHEQQKLATKEVKIIVPPPYKEAASSGSSLPKVQLKL